MTNQRGMTILELMMAVAVGTILIAVGVPSFVTTIRNSEMTSATNALVGGLHAARSESVKRRARVTICRSKLDGGNPTCDATGPDLTVFVNAANDMTIDPGDGDIVIQSAPWLPATISISSAEVPPVFSFNASGFTRTVGGATVSGDVVFCGPRGNPGARVLTLAPTGRPLVRHHGDVAGATDCPSS